MPHQSAPLYFRWVQLLQPLPPGHQRSGILRDVLAGEIPLVLRRELYATAGVAAALGYLLTGAAGAGQVPAMVAGVAIGLATRLAALRWNLGLPVYRSRQ